MTEADKQRWRDDPVAFIREVLETPLTEQQAFQIRQIAKQRGHSVGSQKSSLNYLKVAGLAARARSEQ